LPGCETLLQNVKRRVFFCSLPRNIIWSGKYPEEQNHPNYPPNEVHPTINAAVKHDFFILIVE